MEFVLAVLCSIIVKGSLMLVYIPFQCCFIAEKYLVARAVLGIVTVTSPPPPPTPFRRRYCYRCRRECYSMGQFQPEWQVESKKKKKTKGQLKKVRVRRRGGFWFGLVWFRFGWVNFVLWFRFLSRFCLFLLG